MFSSIKLLYTLSCTGKEANLYSAYYVQLTSRCSGMARVNTGSHSFTCHPHAYPQVESTIYLPLTPAALWLVLILHPAKGRRLSWPGRLGEILRWFASQRRSPILVFLAWLGTELATVESRVQCPNHYRQPSHLCLISLRTETAACLITTMFIQQATTAAMTNSARAPCGQIMHLYKLQGRLGHSCINWNWNANANYA